MRVWVYREVYAVCDGCGYDAHTLGVAVPCDSRRDAIAYVRRYGWRVIKGRLLCLECQKDAHAAAGGGARARRAVCPRHRCRDC